ncbi:DUF6193 family natural product biosynthesis protein [Streptomyces sp. NPDC101149]|uniref:DUF6193 family natural product biosynthesis protein n=1 Tax=Streptomyces sp. NPDC101149 TaxID=3366113 RepID=UPI0037FC2B26
MGAALQQVHGDAPHLGHSLHGTLRDGRYYVEGPSRTSPRIAETDSAQAAVAMVIDRLPPHCGPAFIGNAEELGAYERAQGNR